MNTKNRKLLIDVEEAIGEYACEVKVDGQYNVSWSERTAMAHFGLRAQLLKLEKALP